MALNKYSKNDLAKNWRMYRMIISADFNFNFADDRNIPLIDFFNEALGLTMSNNRILSTAKCKTMIDAIFSQYFHKF